MPLEKDSFSQPLSHNRRVVRGFAQFDTPSTRRFSPGDVSLGGGSLRGAHESARSWIVSTGCTVVSLVAHTPLSWLVGGCRRTSDHRIGLTVPTDLQMWTTLIFGGSFYWRNPDGSCSLLGVSLVVHFQVLFVRSFSTYTLTYFASTCDQ